MTVILALTEGERVAIIAGALAIFAGVPGAIAAVITAKTRKENSDQHGASQKKLNEVHTAVTGQGVKIDELSDDVKDLGAKVDGHTATLARHDERLDRHDGVLDMTDNHPIL